VKLDWKGKPLALLSGVKATRLACSEGFLLALGVEKLGDAVHPAVYILDERLSILDLRLLDGNTDTWLELEVLWGGPALDERNLYVAGCYRSSSDLSGSKTLEQLKVRLKMLASTLVLPSKIAEAFKNGTLLKLEKRAFTPQDASGMFVERPRSHITGTSGWSAIGLSDAVFGKFLEHLRERLYCFACSMSHHA